MLTGKFGSFTFIVIADITGFIITLFGAIFLKAFPILFSPLFFPFWKLNTCPLWQHRWKRRDPHPLPLSSLKSKQGQKPKKPGHAEDSIAT